MTDITSLRKSRGAYRNVTKKLFSKFDTVDFDRLNEEEKVDLLDDISSTINTLKIKQNTIKEIDDKIATLIDTENLEDELESVTEFDIVVEKCLAKYYCKAFLPT